ncbi:MAG: hypothetical protein ACP5KJ_02915 [Candidatus Micrarchaeia archaeon]
MEESKKNIIMEFVKDTLLMAVTFAVVYAGICGMRPARNVGDSQIETINSCLSGQVYSFVSENKDRIKKYASEYNVPVMLIAATIMNENECRPRYEDWLDEIGGKMNLNVSYGMAQIKIETARELYKKYFGETISREMALSVLKDTDSSIRLIALFYRNEIESMGLNVAHIEQDPSLMARLFSTYVGGRRYNSIDAEMIGYNALLHVADPRLSNALDIDYPESNRDKIRQFLNSKKSVMSRNLNENSKLHAKLWQR